MKPPIQIEPDLTGVPEPGGISPWVNVPREQQGDGLYFMPMKTIPIGHADLLTRRHDGRIISPREAGAPQPAGKETHRAAAGSL
jgi:hypothetical protein